MVFGETLTTSHTAFRRVINPHHIHQYLAILAYMLDKELVLISLKQIIAVI
jgi:hypothetical protein